MGLLTDRINNKLEKSNLIYEHALNREPVPLSCHSQIYKRNSTLNVVKTSSINASWILNTLCKGNKVSRPMRSLRDVYKIKSQEG